MTFQMFAGVGQNPPLTISQTGFPVATDLRQDFVQLPGVVNLRLNSGIKDSQIAARHRDLTNFPGEACRPFRQIHIPAEIQEPKDQSAQMCGVADRGPVAGENSRCQSKEAQSVVRDSDNQQPASFKPAEFQTGTA